MNTSNMMMRSMNVNSSDFKGVQQPLYMDHSDSSNVKLFDRRNCSLSPQNFETEPGINHDYQVNSKLNTSMDFFRQRDHTQFNTTIRQNGRVFKASKQSQSRMDETNNIKGLNSVIEQCRN